MNVIHNSFVWGEWANNWIINYEIECIKSILIGNIALGMIFVAGKSIVFAA